MGEKFFFFCWVCILNPLLFFSARTLNDPHLVHFYITQHKVFLIFYFFILFLFAFYFLTTSKNKIAVCLCIFLVIIQLVGIALMKST
jgi:hypothetical protein